MIGCLTFQRVAIYVPLMEYVRQIEVLERRAQAVNLSLHRLCQAAHVNYHHITRWRSGQVNPTVTVLNRDLGKLESALDDVERRIFAALAPRHGASDSRQSA